MAREIEERTLIEISKAQYALLDAEARYKKERPLDYLFDKWLHPDKEYYLPSVDIQNRNMNLEGCLRSLADRIGRDRRT